MVMPFAEMRTTAGGVGYRACGKRKAWFQHDDVKCLLDIQGQMLGRQLGI